MIMPKNNQLTLFFPCVNITDVVRAGLSELADEADSKSVGGNIVRVQVPQPALDLKLRSDIADFSFFMICVNYNHELDGTNDEAEV